MRFALKDKVTPEYKKVINQLTDGEKRSVAVGIFEAEGGQAHEDSLLSVLEVATFHEFGTDTIPERSFLRAYIDENQDRLLKMAAALYKGVVKGTYTKEQALELLGLKMVGEVQARITSGIGPPLADSTVARKGSTLQLVDSGQMRASITSKIVEKP